MKPPKTKKEFKKYMQFEFYAEKPKRKVTLTVQGKSKKGILCNATVDWLNGGIPSYMTDIFLVKEFKSMTFLGEL